MEARPFVCVGTPSGNLYSALILIIKNKPVYFEKINHALKILDDSLIYLYV